MTAEVNAKKRVPLEIIHPGAREQSRRLRWIAPTETYSLHGISIRGGFFLQPAGSFRFSFAIDPALPIGDAALAERINLRPHQHLSYDGLTPNQRARFLNVLARSSGNQVQDEYFCLQLAGF